MIKNFDPKEMADAVENVKYDFEALHQVQEIRKQKLRENEEEEK